MKVQFTDTFTKSLEKMINRERWYWKTYDFIRYDFPYFLRNLRKFRKDLWRYRDWDAKCGLRMLGTSLEITADYIEKHGHEVVESSSKKIIKMRRAAEIIKNQMDENFMELAEKELGLKFKSSLDMIPVEDGEMARQGLSELVDKSSPAQQEVNQKIINLSHEIEKEQWKELCRILEGQDYSKFKSSPDGASPDEAMENWYSQFDGSGLLTWWD